MKKIMSFLIIGITLLFTGCNAIKPKKLLTQPVAKLEETSNKLAKVEIVGYQENYWTSQTRKQGFSGINLEITNLTDKVIEVDWNSSNLDDSAIILGGQQYNKAGNNNVPKTLIAGKRVLTKTAYPVDKIYWDSEQYLSGWKNGEMNFPTVFILKIKQGNVEEDFIFDISIPNQ